MKSQSREPAPHGIPTVYKGRQFRSRLEARWAAFFDLLHWPYEYEPFDLAGWIPDFLLLGKTRVLVEVKPAVDFPEDIADEISIAAGTAGWDGELLIVGASISPGGPYLGDVQLGWLGETARASGEPFDPADWETKPWWFSEASTYGCIGLIGISSNDYTWFDRIHGAIVGKDGFGNPEVGEKALDLWTRAGNLTQWRGKQSIVS
jgi:hypothetical protein